MQARIFIQQHKKGIGISRLELAQFAPVENFLRQHIAFGSNFLQNIGAGLPGSSRRLFAFQPLFFKQNLADLSGRADIKLLSGRLKNLFLNTSEFIFKIGTQLSQAGGIYHHPLFFHGIESVQKRTVKILIDRGFALSDQTGLENAVNPQNIIRALRQITHRGRGFQLTVCYFIFTGTEQVFNPRQPSLKKQTGQINQRMAVLRTVKVIRNNGDIVISRNLGIRDNLADKMPGGFKPAPDFQNCRIRQQRAQVSSQRFRRQLRGCGSGGKQVQIAGTGLLMIDRNITSLSRCNGQSQAANTIKNGIDAFTDNLKTECPGSAGTFQPSPEFGFRFD